eukprot:gene13180-30666_t
MFGEIATERAILSDSSLELATTSREDASARQRQDVWPSVVESSRCLLESSRFRVPDPRWRLAVANRSASVRRHRAANSMTARAQTLRDASADFSLFNGKRAGGGTTQPTRAQEPGTFLTLFFARSCFLPCHTSPRINLKSSVREFLAVRMPPSVQGKKCENPLPLDVEATRESDKSMSLLYWLPVLAVLFSPVSAVVFESHPDCGFNTSEFLDFENNDLYPALAYLGVCGWGFDLTGLLNAEGEGNVGNCVGCRYVREGLACPDGFSFSSSDVWQLYPIAACAWSTGCLDQACPTGQYEAETAICGAGGSRSRRCCRKQSYRQCCRKLVCTGRSSPAGGCVVGDKDLLPDQSFPMSVAAVPQASTLCFPYTYLTTRTCLSNRTFASGNFYDTCSTVQTQKDSNGCVIAPGFQFQPSSFYADPSEALLDDGTPWDALTPEAVADATADVTLMAARCRGSPLCTTFDNTGAKDLRYYVPTSQRWETSSTDPSNSCLGSYIKSRVRVLCPRLRGYLFKPMVTDSTATTLCSDCWNVSSLAAECTASAECSGFSNRHGLLLGGTDSFPVVDSRVQYTTTPCMGMFLRIQPQLPAEVEQIDVMLCGIGISCRDAIEYSASTSRSSIGLSYATDISITLHSSFLLPTSLTTPNAESVASLPVMPRVRSIVINCVDGAEMLGGLPKPLMVVFPNLEQLQLTSCGILDSLPNDWYLLTSLKVLDLSDNLLSGSLPDMWQDLRLGFLNLSNNVLTGQLPDSWVDVVALQAAPQDTAGGPLPVESARAVLTTTTTITTAVAGTESATSAEVSLQRRQLLIADLSLNELDAPMERSFVQSACYDRDILLWFRQCECGSYIIVISCLWGSFALLLLGILLWWRWRAYRLKHPVAPSKSDAARDLSPHHSAASSESSDSGEDPNHARADRLSTPSPDGKAHVADSRSPLGDDTIASSATRDVPGGIGSIAETPTSDTVTVEEEEKAAKATTAWSFNGWFDTYWPKTWVRRCIFIARLTILIVDSALDISVAVWLANDGSRTESIVCIVFLALAQLSVTLGVFCTFVPILFGSMFKMVVLSPIMLALTPVVSPFLAVWNVWDPDVPLVFWRYLELVEFSVMLLQAPAEAVTQTIVYARQNVIANGMYLNHGLFLASIVFSLADMLISIFKLLRYKHGPWRRVYVAFTHLDKTRDTFIYKTDFSYYTNYRPGEDPNGAGTTHPLLLDAARKSGKPFTGVELSSPGPRPYSGDHGGRWGTTWGTGSGTTASTILVTPGKPGHANGPASTDPHNTPGTPSSGASTAVYAASPELASGSGPWTPVSRSPLGQGAGGSDGAGQGHGPATTMSSRLGLTRMHDNPTAEPYSVIPSSTSGGHQWDDNAEFEDIAQSSAGMGSSANQGSEVVAGLMRRVGSATNSAGPTPNFANTPKWGLARPPKWPGSPGGQPAMYSPGPRTGSGPSGFSPLGGPPGGMSPPPWRPSSVPDNKSRGVGMSPGPLRFDEDEDDQPLQSRRVPSKGLHAGPSGRLRLHPPASSEIEPVASAFQAQAPSPASGRRSMPSHSSPASSPSARVLAMPKAPPSTTPLPFSPSRPGSSPASTTPLPFSPSRPNPVGASASGTTLSDIHSILQADATARAQSPLSSSRPHLSPPTTAAGARPRSRQSVTSHPSDSVGSSLRSAGSGSQSSGRKHVGSKRTGLGGPQAVGEGGVERKFPAGAGGGGTGGDGGGTDRGDSNGQGGDGKGDIHPMRNWTFLYSALLAAMCACLGVVMTSRAKQSGKVMPSGIIGVSSLAMACGFLLTGK